MKPQRHHSNPKKRNNSLTKTCWHGFYEGRLSIPKVFLCAWTCVDSSWAWASKPMFSSKSNTLFIMPGRWPTPEFHGGVWHRHCGFDETVSHDFACPVFIFCVSARRRLLGKMLLCNCTALRMCFLPLPIVLCLRPNAQQSTSFWEPMMIFCKFVGHVTSGSGHLFLPDQSCQAREVQKVDFLDQSDMSQASITGDTLRWWSHGNMTLHDKTARNQWCQWCQCLFALLHLDSFGVNSGRHIRTLEVCQSNFGWLVFNGPA